MENWKNRISIAITMDEEGLTLHSDGTRKETKALLTALSALCRGFPKTMCRTWMPFFPCWPGPTGKMEDKSVSGGNDGRKTECLNPGH